MKVTATIRVMSDVDALRTATILTMERLCFASAEAFESELPSGETVDASVSFAGPKVGAVSIAIPPATLSALVEDLLPGGELPSADFVAELANIVCGNVVPRIYGRDSVFALSPPETERDAGPVIATAVVRFEHGWVAAMLHGVWA
jgi:hypothetical protein